MQSAIPFWQYSSGGGGGGGGGGFSVALSSTFEDGYGFWNGVPPASVIYTVNAVSAIPFGGVAPYTYAWAEVGGPSGIDIQNPTSQSTRFSEYSTSGAYSKTGYFECTVTDATMATATSGQVEILIEQTT